MKQQFMAFERRVLALISIAVPTVFFGIAMTTAESYNPKSINYDLFNQHTFRTHVRNVHSLSDQKPSTASNSVHTAAPESGSGDLTFNDLTVSQRDTLRKQLRIGGCPQDVDAAYRKLCESLLKKRQQPVLRQGLRNPNQ